MWKEPGQYTPALSAGKGEKSISARDRERYYWLKLHRNFFKRHDIRILEGMPGGKDAVLFYLKLMVESVDHEGTLRFSDAIPYTEAMLASITNTDEKTVHTSLASLRELGLLEIREDGTFFLPGVAKLLDSETYASKRKRYQRWQTLPGDNVPCLSPACPQEKETEKETETDTETETETDTDTETEGFTVPDGTVCRPSDSRRVMQAWNSLGLQQLVRLTGDSRRGQMLAARIREYGIDTVLKAIEKIRRSPFLKGQGAKGWVITFDWFVRPNNFPKVLEGNYEEGKPPAKQQTSNPFLAMLLEEGEA